MDEEYPNYQKLLDGISTDPTPVTLPELPSLATIPTASGLKRSRTLPMKGAGELEDTGACGSGTHPEANVSGSADPTLPPPQGSAGQADAEAPPELDRTDVVTAFVA